MSSTPKTSPASRRWRTAASCRALHAPTTPHGCRPPATFAVEADSSTGQRTLPRSAPPCSSLQSVVRPRIPCGMRFRTVSCTGSYLAALAGHLTRRTNVFEHIPIYSKLAFAVTRTYLLNQANRTNSLLLPLANSAFTIVRLQYRIERYFTELKYGPNLNTSRYLHVMK